MLRLKLNCVSKRDPRYCNIVWSIFYLTYGIKCNSINALMVWCASCTEQCFRHNLRGVLYNPSFAFWIPSTGPYGLCTQQIRLWCGAVVSSISTSLTLRTCSVIEKAIYSFVSIYDYWQHYGTYCTQLQFISTSIYICISECCNGMTMLMGEDMPIRDMRIKWNY